MRRTTRPQFVTVQLAGGVDYTLNLETYDPQNAVQTAKGWRVTLTNNQVITMIEDKSLLDAEYARYLELKEARA